MSLRPNDRVKVFIGLTGTHTMLRLPYSRYKSLVDEVTEAVKKKEIWVHVDLDRDVTINLRPDTIQYIKVQPSHVEEATAKEGVTLLEASRVIGEKYHTLRQRLKRDGIELDKTSDRRIKLTERNFKLLGLTGQQQQRLKQLEEKA